MDWLLPGTDVRGRLKQVLAGGEGAPLLDALRDLSLRRLNFLETIQVDRAIGSVAAAAAPSGPIRVALLSSCTADHLAPGIRVAGMRRGLWLDVLVGGYGQYRQELLDKGSRVHAFSPQVVILSLTARDVLGQVPVTATRDEAESAVTRAVADMGALWTLARESLGASVIQQNFLDVSEPLFGSFEHAVPGAPATLMRRLNHAMMDAAHAQGVAILDVAGRVARDGRDAWYDVTRWLQAKQEIAPSAAPLYGELVARVIGAQRGASRKCLVLDLDNTIWGGVIGDDGIDGIKLGEGSALGEAHLALQRYAKSLKERGVLLAVCSKNDQTIAESVFRDHKEMILRLEDIAAFVANWSDKAANLRAIAEKLNIGIDSLVFVDDNPAERTRVRDALPMVAVPELPEDPALYVSTIAAAGYFEAVSFTADDARRAEQYAENERRAAMMSSAATMEDFLRGLQMEVRYGAFAAGDLPRVTQLINKTNQFNTTTRRYAAEEVASIASSRDHVTLQFRLIDRLGDNGLVSTMILSRAADDPSVLQLDNWVMSCRVFGRELEFEAMSLAVEAARAAGAREIRARFVPTAKNAVIKELFPSLGFVKVAGGSGDAEPSDWSLDIAGYEPRSTHIARKAE